MSDDELLDHIEYLARCTGMPASVVEELVLEEHYPFLDDPDVAR